MAERISKLVSDLDFETIRANIAAYIANNTTFTDYNFEGSGLALILDILAYNTHYNAVYLNMALNENFIDTAQTRSSIVSIAKNLGYTPRSRKSAISNISFRIPTTDPENTSLTLDKTTNFTGDIDGTTYIFQPVVAYTSRVSGGYYTFTDVRLREGSRFTIRYPITATAGEKFFINNFNIDTDSIEVYVKELGQTGDLQTYNLVSDITILDSEEQIFYLFESVDRNYIIQFGDGVLGKKPEAGDTVLITFQTSSGEAANGISKFTLSTTIGTGRDVGLETFGSSDIVYDNVEVSHSGSAEEGIESIRTSALNNFYTQGRAVTAEDYKFFLERDYPQAESISVWGGQDNVPPIYGKVFISFKPKKGFRVTNSVKQEILNNVLGDKNIISIIPEIIDPEYTFITVNSSVLFDPKRTIYTSSELSSIVRQTISNFNVENLIKFGTRFSYSKFVSSIDNADSSIISNYSSIKLRKNIDIILDVTSTYTINFQNRLREGTFASLSSFKAVNDSTLGLSNEDYYLEDDSSGLLRIYKFSAGTKVIVKANAGTINYNSGLVQITNFKPSSIPNEDNTLDLISEPFEYTVTSFRNNILTIVDTDVSINMTVE
jgi:hypothetical protein